MSDSIAYALERVSPHALRPYANNARTHSKRQVKLITNSIKRFGFVTPVLADKSGRIIAGHARVEAAKMLGLETIPVRYLDHLNEAEIRALIIADNRLAEKAGWDREILAFELNALVDLDFEVELTGFETAEIDLILGEAAEAGDPAGSPDDDVPVPAPGAPVTRIGDIWYLGDHRLICGDSQNHETYASLMAGEQAALIVTDPPYNVRIDGHVGGKGAVKHRDFVMASGEMSATQFTTFLGTVFEHAVAVSRNGSLHLIFMDWRHVGELLDAGHAVYSALLNLCVWNKTNAGMGSLYRSQHELCFVWKRGTAEHVNNVELGRHGRNRSNVWTYAGINAFRKDRIAELTSHPTVKPVAMIADAILDCSKRNDLVLDPFCGSGTVLVACEKTGRKARAIEIDPVYVDVAVRRWQTFSGRAATLEGSSQTFEDVELERSAIRKTEEA